MLGRQTAAFAFVAPLLAIIALLAASCDDGFLFWRDKGGWGKRPKGEPVLRSPDEIRAPEQTIAGTPTSITLVYEDSGYFSLISVEQVLDEHALTLELKMWFQEYELEYPPPPCVWFVEEKVTTTFPVPGTWTISSRDKSVEIEVLPSQGGGQ